ncbi:RluA family pseudouridine synthase [Labilibaculum antarcticum]|uniref:RNA pseudouridine synthase n=1 Tax=Labilibaculum antarcticum TaxID=1717717 RepID=A0A1Y1CJ27_9BACT|nr:RluA family pseudouridine synthase [Labilibaculum antarcticum]BAX79281.1 RNA pseudouridine synthase [Labilibaculum antarcticum]
MAKEQLDILFEDNHIIAINKRCGDIVQGDKTGDEPLSEKVKAYIKEKYNKPGDVFLGVPHRIDRPVSGVIIFAKTSKALTRLSLMFQQKDKEISKIYWAIVQNCPRLEEETLTHFLLKNEEKNKSNVYDKLKHGAKEASLEYKLMTRTQNYFLLEVKLHTGRHHQIRAQLAKIGVPIRGDLKYGAPRSKNGGGIGLHAREISFIHPVKQELIRIVAPVPQNDNLWRELANQL